LIVTIRQGVGGRSGRDGQKQQSGQNGHLGQKSQNGQNGHVGHGLGLGAWCQHAPLPLLPTPAVKDSAEQSGAKVETTTANHENHKA